VLQILFRNIFLNFCNFFIDSNFSIRGGERQIERGEGWKSQENRFVNKPNFKTNNILKQVLFM